jgi:hypothetical protein
MLNNIYRILECLGFLSQHRAVYFQFSNTLLNIQVFLQRIDGKHKLNAGFSRAELICLSTTNATMLLNWEISVY